MRKEAVCKNLILFVSRYPGAFLIDFARAVAQLDNDLFVRIISDEPFGRSYFSSLVLYIKDDELLEAGYHNSNPDRGDALHVSCAGVGRESVNVGRSE